MRGEEVVGDKPPAGQACSLCQVIYLGRAINVPAEQRQLSKKMSGLQRSEPTRFLAKNVPMKKATLLVPERLC